MAKWQYHRLFIHSSHKQHAPSIDFNDGSRGVNHHRIRMRTRSRKGSINGPIDVPRVRGRG